MPMPHDVRHRRGHKSCNDMNLRGFTEPPLQFGQRYFPPMEGEDLVNRQFESLDVVVQIHIHGVGLRGRGSIGSAGRIRISFDQELLLREIRHDETVVMHTVLNLTCMGLVMAIIPSTWGGCT